MVNNSKIQAQSDGNFLFDTQKNVSSENFGEYTSYSDFCKKLGLSGQPAIKYLLDELKRREEK